MDANQPVAVKSLKNAGFFVWFNPTGYFVTEKGAADLVVIKNGRAAFIEVKACKTKFLLSASETGGGWRENQIEWALNMEASGTSCWLWITFYTKPVVKTRVLHDSFLVPFSEVYNLLKTMPQKTLPYNATDTNRKNMEGFSAVSLWGQFRLIWEKGLYIIPASHDFYRVFC